MYISEGKVIAGNGTYGLLLREHAANITPLYVWYVQDYLLENKCMFPMSRKTFSHENMILRSQKVKAI